MNIGFIRNRHEDKFVDFMKPDPHPKGMQNYNIFCPVQKKQYASCTVSWLPEPKPEYYDDFANAMTADALVHSTTE